MGHPPEPESRRQGQGIAAEEQYGWPERLGVAESFFHFSFSRWSR
jgi:hypothetical protein